MIGAKVIQRSARRLPPGPRGYPVVGVLPQVLRNPLETLTDAARRYGGVVYLGSYRPGRPVILVSHPGPLKRLLQERYGSYGRGFVAARLARLLGKSVLFLNGEPWLQRRRLLQPAFHKAHGAHYAATITDTTAAMLEEWRGPAAHGQALDVAFEMSKLTREIILKVLFGFDLAGGSDETIEIERSLKTAESYGGFLTFTNPLPLWVPTPHNRAVMQALRTFDRTVLRVIDERRRSEVERHDLMSLLLNARDQDTGEMLSDRELRDEVRTAFLAGHETTAASLAWTWSLISLHPEVERRLHAEVDEILGGRLPTPDDLPGLVYTRMVAMESMRLFPPAWLLSRALQSDEEDEIDGYTIDKKTLLFYSPYVTHRLPELWENPDAFDPERFAPGRAERLPQFTYIPFGGGPRQCIGNSLAMTEIQLILATAAQRYSLRLAPGARVEPEPLITLQMRNGLPMTLHPREGNHLWHISAARYNKG
jgi:cytochrome P450